MYIGLHNVYLVADIYEEEISDGQFNLFMSRFLFSPKGARFQANFKFAQPLKCGQPASKIQVTHYTQFLFFYTLIIDF